MIPGYRAFPCFNMVQFEGICLIHLPELLFGNFPGKVKDSSFVSAAPVRAGRPTSTRGRASGQAGGPTSTGGRAGRRQ